MWIKGQASLSKLEVLAYRFRMAPQEAWKQSVFAMEMRFMFGNNGCRKERRRNLCFTYIKTINPYRINH